ncbi:MAG: hypothetical protein FJZ97_07095 [Chloroflexi bacterium]|nr:hypothetical protein [Chloroflexota bacterium]
MPLTPHEWLSQVAFAASFRLLGLDGVVLLCALLIGLTFALVYRSAAARSGLPLAALAITLLAAAASSLHWLARPHLFTLLLVAVWTGLLDGIRNGQRTIWWALPLVMLLWVNLHGAFIFGFIIWLAYAAGWSWRRWVVHAEEPAGVGRSLALGGALSLAVTALNPVGLKLWATSLGYAGNAYLVGHTAEYLSPNFHDVSTWPFLLMILTGLWLVAAARPRLSLESALLLMGWLGLALVSVRHVPVFAIVSAPILTGCLPGVLQASAPGLAWQRREAGMARLEGGLRGHAWPIAVTLAAGLALAGSVPLTPFAGGNAFSPRVFPVQAVNWLESRPPTGRVFNYFPWGGYVLYRLWPDVRVFIDGQTDFYGEALTREYEQVITLSDGWEAVLEKYDVVWVLMPPDSGLARALHSDSAWSEVYADATAVVLERAP